VVLEEMLEIQATLDSKDSLEMEELAIQEIQVKQMVANLAFQVAALVELVVEKVVAEVEDHLLLLTRALMGYQSLQYLSLLQVDRMAMLLARVMMGLPAATGQEELLLLKVEKVVAAEELNVIPIMVVAIPNQAVPVRPQMGAPVNLAALARAVVAALVEDREAVELHPAEIQEILVGVGEVHLDLQEIPVGVQILDKRD
jgi:hypothetical protein